MVTLKGRGILLRPLRMSDAESLQKHINYPEINKTTLAVPYPYSLKDARDAITKFSREYARKNPTNITFGIVIDRRVVGGIGIDNIQGHMAKIGYWLGKEYWGQGIMSRAVKLVTTFGFRHLRLRRIEAAVFTTNPASARVLEKAGYCKEGLLRKRYKKNGKLIDAILYAKVR